MTDSRNRLEAVLATPPEQRLDAAITAVAEVLEELREELRRWREAQAKPARGLPGWRAGGDPTGTSLAGYFPASYAQLVALLGEPAPESDGYKVSTEWTFTDADGQCVTLYDYKETNLYDGDLPSVEEFRARPSHDWHIGARNRDIAQRFTDALKAALEH